MDRLSEKHMDFLDYSLTQWLQDYLFVLFLHSDISKFIKGLHAWIMQNLFCIDDK
jgi:hypothetical protein